MSNARDIANIISGTYDIPAASLDNAVPADGSITAAKIAANAITTDKIAAGAVGSTDLANAAVTAEKIAEGAIQTSVAALESTLPLVSGQSITQQKTVFMDWSGKVGKQPQLASSSVAVSDAQSIDSFFSGGTVHSNKVRTRTGGGGSSQTCTVYVDVKSGDYSWTNVGSFNLTAPSMSGSGAGPNYYGADVRHLGGNKFFVYLNAQNYDQNYDYYYANDLCPLEIDLETGAYTVGTKVSINSKLKSGSLSISKLEDGVNGFLKWGTNNAVYTLGAPGSVTFSFGGSIDSNFPPYVNGALKTSNGLYVAFYDTNYYRFTMSGQTMGAVTVTPVPAGLSIGGITKLNNSAFLTQTGATKLSSFSIDQTDGSLSLTGEVRLNQNLSLLLMKDDKRRGVAITYNYNNNYYSSLFAVPFAIDENGAVSGYGIPALLTNTDSRVNGYGWYTYYGTIQNQQNDEYDIQVRNGYGSGTYPANRVLRVTVPSYDSGTLNLLGVAKSTSNTGNGVIKTKGVIDGFTGLVPGLNYYADVSNTSGDLTLINTGSQYLVGYSVSPTQILR